MKSTRRNWQHCICGLPLVRQRQNRRCSQGIIAFQTTGLWFDHDLLTMWKIPVLHRGCYLHSLDHLQKKDRLVRVAFTGNVNGDSARCATSRRRLTLASCSFAFGSVEGWVIRHWLPAGGFHKVSMMILYLYGERICIWGIFRECLLELQATKTVSSLRDRQTCLPVSSAVL